MCNGHHGGHEGIGRCCPPGGWVRGFIQPWLLLLLLQKPSYGYELMERLAQDEETPDSDPGLLYRTLRQLEEEGLVRSAWDTEGRGPARRLYQVTPEGVEYIHAWAIKIRRTRQRLDRFLAEYETHFQGEKGGE
jgi:PadR family transcriptional regulator PadR